jgi:AIG2-like family
MHLDSTEGVPGCGYRHVVVEVEGDDGRRCDAIAYIAEGMHGDGKPSRRYITLPRDGARVQGLPADYISFLDSIEHAV